MPDLELAIPAPRSRPEIAKAKPVEEQPIELAIDIRQQYQAPPPPPPPPNAGMMATNSAVAATPNIRGGVPAAPPRMAPAPVAAPRLESEEEFEARTLANYGDPPTNALLTPLYSWRVHKRKKELLVELHGRREDSRRATRAAEDALVAVADRVRERASKDPGYSRHLQDIKTAEELVRSRDQVLAREEDAQKDRLRAIDARISEHEKELAAAQAEERKLATALADSRAALERAEAKTKRIEIEIRNATAQREAKG